MTNAEVQARSRFHDQFIGRDAELAALLAAVERPGAIVSVTGQSGIGKSRLIAEALPDLRALPGVEDVHVIDCADAVGVDEVRVRISEVFGVPDRDVVLVLDHADGVRADVPDLPAVGEPGTRYVVASVLPPDVDGIERIDLEPLATPDDEAVNTPTDAMALFIARVTEVSPDYTVDAVDLPHIASLIRSLGGVPLAIELAAARHGLLGLAGLARLGDSDDAIGALGRRTGDRRTSMAAALEWTIQQLTPEQRGLLTTLTVFAGDVDTTVIADVHHRDLADVLDSLALLVDLHLVEPTPGPVDTLRFRLRPLVAHSVRPYVSPATEHSLRSRHAAHYADAARRGADLVLDGRDDEVDPALSRDLGEVRLACEWLRDHGEASVALRCAADLTCLLQPQFAVQRTRLLLRDLLSDSGADRADRAGDVTLAAARIAAAASELAVANGPDEVQHANALWQQGYAVAATQDQRLSLWAHAIQVRMLPVTGDFKAAAASAQAGLELSTALGHPVWQARFEAWAGMVHHKLRDFPRAVELGERALRRSLTTGDRTALTRVGMLLHQIPPEEWDGDPMLPSMEVLLDHARDLGDLSAQRWLLGNLAIAAVLSGDLPAATRWQGESLAMVREDREAAISLHATLLWAAAQGDHHAVARLRGASRPWEQVGLGSLPPRAVDRFHDGVTAAVSALGQSQFDAVLADGAQTPITANVQYARDLVARSLAGAPTEPDVTEEGPVAALSPREHQVLTLLTNGLRNKEIARQLGTTPKTVMHHTSAIYRKLGVRGRAEAVALALREDLVPTG